MGEIRSVSGRDFYVRGELGGLHSGPTYKQENACAFPDRPVAPSEAKQHRAAAHQQTQVGHVEQVCRGQRP